LLDDGRIRIREAQKTYGSYRSRSRSGSTTLLVTMRRLFQAVLIEALKMLTEAVRVLAQVVKILVATTVLIDSNGKSSIVEERILRFVFIPSIVEERILRFVFVPSIVEEQILRFVFVPSIV
jgi:hypothetical protein